MRHTHCASLHGRTRRPRHATSRRTPPSLPTLVAPLPTLCGCPRSASPLQRRDRNVRSRVVNVDTRGREPVRPVHARNGSAVCACVRACGCPIGACVRCVCVCGDAGRKRCVEESMEWRGRGSAKKKRETGYGWQAEEMGCAWRGSWKSTDLVYLPRYYGRVEAGRHRDRPSPLPLFTPGAVPLIVA